MLAGNWGASPGERAVALPCDALMPDANLRAHRAISISAPPPVVFRWLCQLRTAPYSYDLLDNFGRRSPRTLTPGLEDLEAGQRFMSIFRLESFERDAHLTLRSGRFVVTYHAGSSAGSRGTGTRLLVRILGDVPAARVAGPPLLLGDLVMMRKQLLTLRDLAQNAERAPSTKAPSPDTSTGKRSHELGVR